MTTRYEVSCTTKDVTGQKIQYLGGTINGQRWRVHFEDAIALITAEKYKFFVLHLDKTFDLVVMREEGGLQMTTTGEALFPRILFHLPDCP